MSNEIHEPKDLGDALRMLNQSHTEEPQEDMAEQEGVREQQAAEPSGEEYAASEEEPAVSVDGGANGGPGGSEPSVSQTDYSAVEKSLIDEATRQAALATNKFFKEQGVRKFTFDDLYKRDEHSGNVAFVDPDTGREFSSRIEAQQWLDVTNKQYESAWMNKANELRRENLQQALPAIRMIQFAPEYDAASKQEQDILDTLIEPYAISDSTGRPIGYSCDLNQAMHQARALASMFGTTKEAQAEAKEQAVAAASSGPAVDIKSSGTTTSKPVDSVEINDINDAMKFIKKNRKK